MAYEHEEFVVVVKANSVSYQDIFIPSGAISD